MDEPGPLAERMLDGSEREGFRAFKMGWGPFGRVSNALDEAIVAAAREAIGAGRRADGRCRRQRRVLAERLQLGAAHRGDAGRATTSPGSRSRCARTRSTISCTCGEHTPRADRRRRGAHPPAVVPALAAGRRVRHRPARRDARSAASARSGGSPGWRRSNGVPFIPHGWNTALGLAADLQLASAHPRHRSRRVPDRLALHRRDRRRPLAARRDGMLADPGRPRPRHRARPRSDRPLRPRRTAPGTMAAGPQPNDEDSTRRWRP